MLIQTSSVCISIFILFGLSYCVNINICYVCVLVRGSCQRLNA